MSRLSRFGSIFAGLYLLSVALRYSLIANYYDYDLAGWDLLVMIMVLLETIWAFFLAPFLVPDTTSIPVVLWFAIAVNTIVIYFIGKLIADFVIRDSTFDKNHATQ